MTITLEFWKKYINKILGYLYTETEIRKIKKKNQEDRKMWLSNGKCCYIFKHTNAAARCYIAVIFTT